MKQNLILVDVWLEMIEAKIGGLNTETSVVGYPWESHVWGRPQATLLIQRTHPSQMVAQLSAEAANSKGWDSSQALCPSGIKGLPSRYLQYYQPKATMNSEVPTMDVS